MKKLLPVGLALSAVLLCAYQCNPVTGTIVLTPAEQTSAAEICDGIILLNGVYSSPLTSDGAAACLNTSNGKNITLATDFETIAAAAASVNVTLEVSPDSLTPEQKRRFGVAWGAVPLAVRVRATEAVRKHLASALPR